MSGTSLDGIDVALVDFAQATPNLIASTLLPFPPELRQTLAALSQPGPNELEQMGLVEAQLAEVYAAAVATLLASTPFSAADIQAIGCHGQTIRHRPQGRYPFTYQIGDMHRLAERTGIRVIADFRRKDVAYGGQGAPLVPAFHHAVFADEQLGRCILNIGGIANLTILAPHQHIQGFDTGPGNCLMDNWVQRCLGHNFDANGDFASSGQLQPQLLTQLLTDPYFQLTGPKSTGREYFHLAWLEQHLQRLQADSNIHSYTNADIQRTLSRFSAGTMALAISRFMVKEVFVCGGGAHNSVLMADLQALLPQCRISTTAELGVHPDWVEAMAFAWLAYAFDNQISGNVPAVTGASKAVVLGVEFSV